MKSYKEKYIRQILEVGCNIQPGEVLIVHSKESNPDLEEILLRIKDGYKIKDVVFLIDQSRKIYEFLKNEPSVKEIKDFVPKYPEIGKFDKFKIIYICDDVYKVDINYTEKLYREMDSLFNIYNNYYYMINGDFYRRLYDGQTTVIVWPNDYWASTLFSGENGVEELWSLINKIVPDKKLLCEERERMKEIRNLLEKSNIHKLYFYTNEGTELRVGLSKYSKWKCEPSVSDNGEYFFNFPSYEIYTSPDYKVVDGKVVLTRPSSLYEDRINYAEIAFRDGRCTQIESDCEHWERFVFDKNNRMTRIGEIALVSSDTPLAKLNTTFKSILLDENTGCHLALGRSIRDCINVAEKKLRRHGFKYYNFSNSPYHQDLVFGSDSISVEAKIGGKRRILLMENGKWTI